LVVEVVVLHYLGSGTLYDWFASDNWTTVRIRRLLFDGLNWRNAPAATGKAPISFGGLLGRGLLVLVEEILDFVLDAGGTCYAAYTAWRCGRPTFRKPLPILCGRIGYTLLFHGQSPSF
jgi:hypothetical protein